MMHLLAFAPRYRLLHLLASSAGFCAPTASFARIVPVPPSQHSLRLWSRYKLSG